MLPYVAGLPILNVIFLQIVGDRQRVCFFPQIDALQQLHQYYPNATFLLNLRQPKHWLQSVKRWNNMRSRLVKCNISSLPTGVGSKDIDMINWYTEHVQMISKFVQQHRSHRLVEVDIESATAGKFLNREFPFVPASCWTHANQH